MRRAWDIIELVSAVLDTRQKRHLIGGTLISVSLLFGGLAVTIISMKEEDK